MKSIFFNEICYQIICLIHSQDIEFVIIMKCWLWKLWVTNIINDGAKKILDKGAVPIFCTITSCDLEKYNNFLLSDGQTSYLKYQHKYAEMQTNLESAIKEINAYIVKLNQSNSCSTPYCHSQIHKRRGGKKNYFKWLYDRLWDGVHGTEDTKIGWAHIISTAIEHNRRHLDSDSDTENKSPKRSWQREKRLKLSV